MQVQEAVHRLLAFPPVSKLLETARPQLDAAYATYAKLHDNVVVSPRYKQAYDLSLQVGGWGSQEGVWVARIAWVRWTCSSDE